MDATPSAQVCQFCIKSKGSQRCALYDQPLMSDGIQIKKLPQCCKATAGFESVIETPEAPAIDPKEIVKHAIDIYTRTVDDLINQGYPRQLAERAAKQSLIT